MKMQDLNDKTKLNPLDGICHCTNIINKNEKPTLLNFKKEKERCKYCGGIIK